MFTIGPHTIDGRVLLAPMAGVSDLPFRQLCQSMGASLTPSEMVTSDISLWHSDKSRLRLARTKGAEEDSAKGCESSGTQSNMSHSKKAPLSVQIAGSEPAAMAVAAKAAEDMGAQIVDINMGCPAKKVCRKLAGSALLKDEALVEKILAAVVAAVSVPVTLKTRTGWDAEHKNGVRIAGIAESCGVAAITVHGRTRACRFNGQAEYDSIARIVEQVSIPVIANGDIDSPERAAKVLKHTGAMAVMIGRAAYGNPWIFRQVNEYLQSGTSICAPGTAELVEVMTGHLESLYAFYGEHKGTRIARKHFGWYCQKHVPAPAGAIKEFNQLETSKSQLDAVNAVLDRSHHYEENAA